MRRTEDKHENKHGNKFFTNNADSKTQGFMARVWHVHTMNNSSISSRRLLR